MDTYEWCGGKLTFISRGTSCSRCGWLPDKEMRMMKLGNEKLTHLIVTEENDIEPAFV